MSVHTLNIAARQASLIRDKLLTLYPSLAEDESALMGTLEGLSDIQEQIAAVVDSIEEDEQLAASIGARIARLAERATRLEQRAEAKKGAILHAMMEAGIPKLQLPTVTLSQVQNPPAVIITDEAAIPEDFLIIPETPAPRIDKKTIISELKSGNIVPGAVLSNPSKRLGWYSK